MGYQGSPVMTQFDFIKSLAYDFMVPHLQRRYTTPNIQRNLRETIKRTQGDYLPLTEPDGHEDEEAGPSDRLHITKTCASCPSSKQKETANKCILCQKPICLEGYWLEGVIFIH